MTIRNMVILAAVFPFVLLVAPLRAAEPQAAESEKNPDARWSETKAWEWYNETGPIVGCNYLPRTAVNMTEMWQKETFDPKTIDEELGWAETAGYNSLRVFVQYLVWKDDPDGLKQRMDEFLAIADKHGMRIMFLPFCDCAFAGREPYLGKQDEPVPGVHNSGWVPSPGLKRVVDRSTWPDLERYIKDLVGSFANDRRVLIWDLYNEPGNSRQGEKSLPLAVAAMRWAREAKPTQPLTIAAWTNFDSNMSKTLMENSDVVSFHGYDRPADMVGLIKKCKLYNRPIICTEWLRRAAGNTFKTILPIFARESVGGYHWGLVAGRTQTYMPWGSKKGDPPPEPWQHDVMHPDGSPYDTEEFELLAKYRADFPVEPDKRRWPKQKAWDWYNNQPRPSGFNYIPANSISYTEMWMPYCFDPDFIDNELSLAQNINFNCLRVVLPFVVWEHDPAVFKKELDTFLAVCDKRGLGVMFTFFDDCHFGSDEKLRNPVYGKQPDVLEGWYANGWTPSPGHDMVRDPSTWPRLEKYVKDIIGAFKNDKRVWVWDLYNEPTNGGLGAASLPLVEKTFKWAREIDPTQPLTIAQWHGDKDLNDIIYENSDIITFHDYGNAENLGGHIAALKTHGRPLVNTEWLNRGRGSTVETCLPVFVRENVGAMHWGLVNGKTQTDLGWGWRPGREEPKVWQHDLFHGNGRPYRAEEIELFHKHSRVPPTYQNPLLPTNLADPAVIRHEGVYYLYATGEVDNDNGTRVYTSTNLVDWQRGPVVFRPGRPHVWAPDVWRDPDTGRFYLYYTVNQTVGVAEADGPLGPFNEVKKFFDKAIDAHLFRDDDGKLYLYYVQQPGFQITVHAMSSPTQLAGDPKMVLRPESEWEKRAGHVTEGPWIIKHQSRYYLLYSGSGANTPDYGVGYATADHPMGPFTRAENNPIVHRSGGLFGPGHGCAIRDDAGEWWHLYHQKQNDRIEWSRFLALDPLWFDKEGKLHGRATRGVAQTGPVVVQASSPQAVPVVVRASSLQTGKSF